MNPIASMADLAAAIGPIVEGMTPAEAFIAGSRSTAEGIRTEILRMAADVRQHAGNAALPEGVALAVETLENLAEGLRFAEVTP